MGVKVERHLYFAPSINFSSTARFADSGASSTAASTDFVVRPLELAMPCRFPGEAFKPRSMVEATVHSARKSAARRVPHAQHSDVLLGSQNAVDTFLACTMLDFSDVTNCCSAARAGLLKRSSVNGSPCLGGGCGSEGRSASMQHAAGKTVV